MELMTYHFGKINYDQTKEILFKEGIPGFEQLKRYIMIEDEDTISPFCYLQSVEDGDISFIMINPYELMPEYEPNIPKACFDKLGKELDDYMVLSITNIPQDIQSATVNLQAPVLMNLETRRAMQIILEGDTYQTKHPLISSAEKKGE